MSLDVDFTLVRPRSGQRALQCMMVQNASFKCGQNEGVGHSSGFSLKCKRKLCLQLISTFLFYMMHSIERKLSFSISTSYSEGGRYKKDPATHKYQVNVKIFPLQSTISQINFQNSTKSNKQRRLYN